MIDFLIYLVSLLAPLWVVYVTYYLVYDNRYALWLKFELFNRKPFNCHKCFSWWTNVLIFIGLTLSFKSYQVSVPYAVMSILLLLMFLYEEKKSVKK